MENEPDDSWPLKWYVPSGSVVSASIAYVHVVVVDVAVVSGVVDVPFPVDSVQFGRPDVAASGGRVR